MDIGTLQGIGTLLAIIAFSGVCIWAWSDKRKAEFEEAANLPFADDAATPSDNRE
ncbi:MAG TPA: cbb3-type cytochrome c oxidase subunit 3 [Pseudomonadales bacterium]|jgi:cytochrome c oxidase cbb3-type subunit 4